jgi:alkylation response protein AidB-like acyl-CoA dehydrogenase
MDFNFTEEQEMLRELARNFTNKEIRPLAKQIDENQSIPSELIKNGRNRTFRNRFSAKYGDGNFGEIGYCILQEEISKACGSIADVFSVFARTEKDITGLEVEKNFGNVIVGQNEKN